MTGDEVFAIVRDAVAMVMEIEPGSVTRESRLVEDLGCDSLALVEIVEVVEEAMRPGAPVHFADEALDDIRTIGDAVDYATAQL